MIIKHNISAICYQQTENFFLENLIEFELYSPTKVTDVHYITNKQSSSGLVILIVIELHVYSPTKNMSTMLPNKQSSSGLVILIVIELHVYSPTKNMSTMLPNKQSSSGLVILIVIELHVYSPIKNIDVNCVTKQTVQLWSSDSDSDQTTCILTN